MAAHNRLDRLGRQVGVVEGDGADVVVEDVSLDDAVEEVATDEAEFAVDGGGGAADVVPGRRLVVGEGGVGVLEVGDGDWNGLLVFNYFLGKGGMGKDIPSQWLTQRYGMKYQTNIFAAPKVLDTQTRAAMVSPTPISLRTMSFASLAS